MSIPCHFLYGGAKSYQLSFLLSSRQVCYLIFGHTLHTFFAFQCFYIDFPLVTKNTHLIRNSTPLRHQQRLIPKRSLTSCLDPYTQGSASFFDKKYQPFTISLENNCPISKNNLRSFSKRTFIFYFWFWKVPSEENFSPNKLVLMSLFLTVNRLSYR